MDSGASTTLIVKRAYFLLKVSTRTRVVPLESAVTSPFSSIERIAPFSTLQVTAPVWPLGNTAVSCIVSPTLISVDSAEIVTLLGAVTVLITIWVLAPLAAVTVTVAVPLLAPYTFPLLMET